MTPTERATLRAVRRMTSPGLVAVWPEVFRPVGTIEEVMAQRWLGLAICGEMFRRGAISILPDGRDLV